MKVNNTEIEKYRVLEFSKPEDANNGMFMVPFEGRALKVIASDGLDWDHVSISLKNRNPNWREMSFIKDLFFEESETVVQFHPKKSEYINFHPFCLHLWRNQKYEFILPPSIMVGPK